MESRSYFVPEEVRALRRTKWCIEDVICLRSHAPHLRRRQSHAIFRSGGGNCQHFDYLGVPRVLGRAISLDDGALALRRVRNELSACGSESLAAIQNPRHDLHPKRQSQQPLSESCPCSSMLSMRIWLPVTPNYGGTDGRTSQAGVMWPLPEPTSIPLRTVCTSQTQVEFFRR